MTFFWFDDEEKIEYFTQCHPMAMGVLFFILHGEIIFLLYLLEQYETKRVLNDIRNVIRKCKSTDVEVLMFERTSKVRESIIITFFFL